MQYAMITKFATQNMVHRPAAWTSPENLLEMLKNWPNPRPSQPESSFRWDSASVCSHMKIWTCLLHTVSYQPHFLLKTLLFSICFITSNFPSYVWAFLYLRPLYFLLFHFRRYFYLRYGDDDDHDAELDYTASAETQFYVENTREMSKAHCDLA